jgi:hypothetical protein
VRRSSQALNEAQQKKEQTTGYDNGKRRPREHAFPGREELLLVRDEPAHMRCGRRRGGKRQRDAGHASGEAAKSTQHVFMPICIPYAYYGN